MKTNKHNQKQTNKHSPDYETMTYNLLTARLKSMGYPEEVVKFQYDPHFAISKKQTEMKMEKKKET